MSHYLLSLRNLLSDILDHVIMWSWIICLCYKLYRFCINIQYFQWKIQMSISI